jgi:hypothetical protein
MTEAEGNWSAKSLGGGVSMEDAPGRRGRRTWPRYLGERGWLVAKMEGEGARRTRTSSYVEDSLFEVSEG